ncbi:MAG: glycosyltransferase family 4 protein, partial [Desulfobacterales bacterium]|nr:glycosyltransferase family 4 protein [Desulfobacterales bacterium]
IGSMYQKPTFRRRLAQNSLNRFFTGASFGLAFNSVSKRYYVEHHGISPDRIAVAPNLVDTDAVFTDRQRFADRLDAKRQELGLAGKKVVLFVGAIEPAKRLDRLIDAFADIRNKVPDSKLLVVGDGYARADAEQRARERNLESHVVFAGKHVADANLYYMLGDVFVLPGLGGLAPSQAMAHGMPVISAPADGTERDLIADGESGYLTTNGPQPDPVEQISEKVTTLLTDDALRQRMSEASVQRIRERFNINRTAEIFQSVIKGVTDPAHHQKVILE